MHDFDTLMADADAAIMETFGSGATYSRPSTGDSESVQVTIDKGVKAIGSDGVSIVTQNHASLIKPVMGCKQGDKIAAGATTYQVIEPLEDDGHMVTLNVNLLS